jgi:aminoglycoside phosphotransferase (APT) family kinase protein
VHSGVKNVQEQHAIAGLDEAAISRWLVGNVANSVAPHRFTTVKGGHSNLTYLVVDARGERSVLRRPPLGPTLPSAHDMGREYRIVSGLWRTGFPVPPPQGYCADAEVTGAPFAITEFVDGLILRDAGAARSISPDDRRLMGLRFVDALAALHAIAPADAALDDLGRGEGHVERQLRRWKGQLEKSRTRELPLLDEVHRRLVSAVPAQQRVSIVHGDYRLENMIFSTDGSLRAVLDWELCTLGDPLTDLGYVLVWWTLAGESAPHLIESQPTVLPGFPTREELVARYALRTGADVTALGFYHAFGLWRLACISEGVYARYRAGAMGDGRSADDVDRIGAQVLALAEAAMAATDGDAR